MLIEDVQAEDKIHENGLGYVCIYKVLKMRM